MKKILNFALLIAFLLSLGFVQPAAAIDPQTWYVSSTLGNDSNTCNAVGTPCLTINAAINLATDGDIVKVAVGTYTASSGSEVVLINKSITLSGGWDEIFTTQDGLSTIDGEGVRRCVYIIQGSVIIGYFVINNGHSSDGSGINFNGHSLRIDKSKITNNFAEYRGAGIMMNGSELDVNNSTIDNNTVGSSGFEGGAAININTGGIISINNSTLSNNKILFNGDSYWGYGSAIESSSTGPVTITLNNSTISGNQGAAGVKFFDGALMINNSTLTLNNKGSVFTVNGQITLQNTIMAGNGSGADCKVDPLNSGVIISQGHNLIGNKTGCPISAITGDKFGTAANPIVPNLASLADNGGPTFTHALYSNSPALNTGDNATCLSTDQRDIARPVETQCDMGAYEGLIPAIYPILKSPGGVTTPQSPKFSWTKVQGATKYQIQVLKGSKKVFSTTISAGKCNTQSCNITPDNILQLGEYTWMVRTLINGAWQSYSPKKYFAVSPAAPGRWTWSDDSPRFYVLKSKPIVIKFSILVRGTGCGIHRITHEDEAKIIRNQFILSGGFNVTGTFTDTKTVSGVLSLKNYYVPGCGSGSGGPYEWSSIWKNNSQPQLKILEDGFSFIPSEDEFGEPFIFEVQK